MAHGVYVRVHAFCYHVCGDSFRRDLKTFLVLLAYTAHRGFAIMRYINLLLTLTLTSTTSGYATWFTAGGAIRIAHYDVIGDVITRKL